MNTSKRSTIPFILIGLIIIHLMIPKIESISAYWTPILSKVCSSNVSKNITQALFACDKLMDQQLSTIFDDCVRQVNPQIKTEKLGRPKLCYYLKQGMQLDQCKMARYQSEGITLPELVDREQDHTWCLMKIAQPLGWERLCSDHPTDITFIMAKQQAIQNCEHRFIEITTPIRDCYRHQVQPNLHHQQQNTSQNRNGNKMNRDRYRPAACLSFQYSRKIWKCLAEKDDANQQSMHRNANLYISCLRSIRPSSSSSQSMMMMA
ncbi:hypothetical protein HUG17_9535 [Dermatophagoides farinae]|uniref:Uncharacterized protein n=2 Tax=Dermatophagoides farinae TaxID=6954 RepID=A0A9D4P375_DERFA|nr:hypothetical protein HUG17_9535 [Dermatophagoides farinae]